MAGFYVIHVDINQFDVIQLLICRRDSGDINRSVIFALTHPPTLIGMIFFDVNAAEQNYSSSNPSSGIIVII